MLNKDSDSLTEIHEPEQDLRSNRDKQISYPGNENLQIVTRSGKVAGLNNANQSKKGFGSNVALTDTVINALHIEHREESASLGVPAIPFESLTLEQAFSENRQAWEESLLDELKSLEKNETFEIIDADSQSANNRKLISSRWVLRNKFNADGSIARRKSRI
ncbi:hypothetical protein K3495_g17278, partial [Podosphaera aphanis]